MNLPTESAIRVSVAAVLRARLADGRLVLLGTGGKAIGPPGGACAYYLAAVEKLGELGWRPQREPDTLGRIDLRGWLPAASLPAFRAWLATGQGRESWEECLRRELAEELAEAGLAHLAELVDATGFWHVRTVVENPTPAPGETMRQLQVFEFVPNRGTADELRARLLTLAEDPAAHTVIPASSDDIVRGRSRTGTMRIGTQAVHLLLP